MLATASRSHRAGRDAPSAGGALRLAWWAAALAAVVGATLTARTISQTQGEVCALSFGVGAAAVLLVRRPDGGPVGVREVIRSPWLVLGCAMLMLAAIPPVEERLSGAELVASPAAVALVGLGGLLALVALAGLVKRRCPGQGLAVVLGEGVLPVAGAFVVWVLALERPGWLRMSPWGSTVAAVAVGGGSWALAVAGFLWCSDDEERPPIGLTGAAFTLLVMAAGLEAASARFCAQLDPRWPDAALVGAMGLWLAATLHPALGARVPSAPTRGPSLSGARRLLVAFTVLLAGPAVVLLDLSGQCGRSPGWVAGGACAVLVIVTSYLMALAGRATRLEHLAYRDELTGVANRSLFMDRLGLALARARRTQCGVAVVFVDLDRFKNVNDSLGHAVGNEVLRAAAMRVRDVAGEDGFVARLGGDEFAMFLGDVDNEVAVRSACAALVRAFERPFRAHGHEVFVTASVGVAHFPDGGGSCEALVRNADAAMYKAKRRGRDTFEVYRPELNAASHGELSLESRLHNAVQRDELRLHYQPKVALTDGSIVGLEALVRWDHPDRGLLRPGAFIHLAEESGLIARIDEWALEQACEQAKSWRRAGFATPTVAVNLSARDFDEHRVEDVVASVLRRTGLDPGALELELTETLAQQDADRTLASLRDIKEMGVHCSIDDFGTGYSSLSLLASLPIDRLKIDK